MSAREKSDALLDAPVTSIKAVSSGRAKHLAAAGIKTVRDLLCSYPHRYIDLGNVASIATAPIGSMATVVGTVDAVSAKQPRPRLHILEVSLVDETGVLMGVWFRQPWMAERFERGMRVALSGKVEFEYGFKRMNAPFVEVLENTQGGPTERMVPVHHATEKLSTTWMRRFVANALEQTAGLHDPLPANLLARHGLMSRKAALRTIHFPRNEAAARKARRRLAYEEAFFVQLEMISRRRAQTAGCEPFVHQPGAAFESLRAALPFELTDEQASAVEDIRRDMCAAVVMNRMLLGDVGTGKTAVAALALALSADTSCQAAMMAPTEVLARQYASKLGGLLDTCGVSWALITGSTAAAKRVEIIAGLADGTIQVAFGTHALIEPDVAFARLSLAVIDEQHRFGVEQRAALRAKGPGCDLLVMTATPIPRTLALALYGDLDTSYIRHRPRSSAPTVTQIVSRDSRGSAYEAIRRAVAAGHQAYIICPLVGLSREERAKRAEAGELGASIAAGSDISDAKAAVDEAERLSRSVFPELEVGLLTGRMPSAQKAQVMESFRMGDIDVLVATTVIEVGVDVPNATVMMIEDAERFGLSQLHQLRGRVGRGEVPGEVYLVADVGANDDQTRQRMHDICTISDGFALAEADLRSRMEGDVLGSRQHGQVGLRLVNVVEDAGLVEMAHADALELLDADPGLDAPGSQALAAELHALFSGRDPQAQLGA